MEKWIIQVLRQILKVASPEIVKSIRIMVAEMVEKAAETANPWDDIFCGLLQAIVGKPDDKI